MLLSPFLGELSTLKGRKAGTDRGREEGREEGREGGRKAGRQASLAPRISDNVLFSDSNNVSKIELLSVFRFSLPLDGLQAQAP